MDVDASTRASLLATESDDSPSQSTVDVNQEQTNTEEQQLTQPYDKVALLQAAAHVRNARKGRSCTHLLDEDSIRLCWLYHSYLFRLIRYANATLYICIAFIELPSWANGSQAYPIFAPLSPADGQYYPTWNLWVLPPTITMSIDMFCIGGFATEMAFKLRFMGRRHFYADRWNTCKVVLIVISVLESLIAFLPILWNRSIASRLIRPFFFVGLSSRLRLSFYAIGKSLRPILEVVLLIVGLVLFAAWASMLLFDSWSCRDSSREDGEMPCFLHQANLLFILLTTANYPDVMMVEYVKNRTSVLFFFVYLMVGLFGLLNLVLAVTYNEYSKNIKEEVKRRQESKDESLDAAFDILDISSDERIEFREWQDLLKILRPDLETQHARTIFQVLDEEKSGYIDRHEFKKVVEAYGSQFKEGPAETDPGVLSERPWDGLSHSERVWRVVKIGWYQWVVRFLLIANMVMVALATEKFARSPESTELLAEPYVEGVTATTLVIASLLNMDLIVKMVAFGLGRWLERRWRVFDLLCGLVVMCGTLVLIIEWNVNKRTHPSTFRSVYFLSLIRSVRLVSESQRVTVVVRTISLMLAPFFTFLGILFVVIYFFATIGIQLYGGLIYKGNPDLNNTSFATEAGVGFYANNYNDYASAMVTCWELLIVNNWYVIMDGFVAASGTQWSRLYFVTYYVVSVIIVLNLFTSFVLEAVTKVDPDEWHGTPHGALFETKFSVGVSEELDRQTSGKWRLETDMRRSFVHDPFFEDFDAATPSRTANVTRLPSTKAQSMRDISRSGIRQWATTTSSSNKHASLR